MCWSIESAGNKRQNINNNINNNNNTEDAYIDESEESDDDEDEEALFVRPSITSANPDLINRDHGSSRRIARGGQGTPMRGHIMRPDGNINADDDQYDIDDEDDRGLIVREQQEQRSLLLAFIEDEDEANAAQHRGDSEDESSSSSEREQTDKQDANETVNINGNADTVNHDVEFAIDLDGEEEPDWRTLLESAVNSRLEADDGLNNEIEYIEIDDDKQALGFANYSDSDQEASNDYQSDSSSIDDEYNKEDQIESSEDKQIDKQSPEKEIEYKKQQQIKKDEDDQYGIVVKETKRRRSSTKEEDEAMESAERNEDMRMSASKSQDGKKKNKRRKDKNKKYTIREIADIQRKKEEKRIENIQQQIIKRLIQDEGKDLIEKEKKQNEDIQNDTSHIKKCNNVSTSNIEQSPYSSIFHTTKLISC
ncbi:MAG: hypothetical protein EZS28_008313 [Streblomastix strix]|uniref:Uncharacterized protein n=1 Tax=Streblomastix strix TaxID=222440 RepID=A0A5J4WNE8_9EUKA|nr:MAG: hypothetical protein EZS28_008313 [Streblomastix strix]